ncbi:MAG: peptidylprolyl isomerase [candidate division Zixibacteria bacterium]|nr:peptidylprolyl isomerase [candidate division Zixibacteria bacterium]MBU1470941.1 peptidylprolyl isomerase [candidate division Zixibacteria bacterium]MBU2625456.1 peptidylprolyl isomerase [candidate division Zixibacteria bacterium]
MKRINGVRFAILVTAAIMIMSGIAASSEVIDEISAVVGDYVILKSEVDFQAQLYAMQQQQRLSPEESAELKEQLLEQMVNDKLILVKALKDTSITVSSDQIEEALDLKLQELKSRFSSQSEFENQMRTEGLTYRELKTKFREEMRNQLYKDKLISRELAKVTISPTELQTFFGRYKDSLPLQPEAVKLAHILLRVTASQATIDSARVKAYSIKGMLDAGADFEQLAKEYSDDPSAADGGDLGYFGKGDLVPEFENVAFALPIGDVSDVVGTQYGFHIIKCIDKQGDRVRCQHILCMAKATDSDKAAIIRFADSLRSLAEGGADFGELVKEYSVDEETKKQGGELGWFVTSDLTPEFAKAIGGLNVGDISPPTESQFGIHVLKVLDRQKSRTWSIDEDRERLKDLARRQKTETVVASLLAEIRSETYVDIR